MAIDSRYKMSQERLDTLKEELHYLETTREKEVAELIKEARSFGDLSENSEYDEAKTEQGKLYSRIAELDEILSNYTIIEEQETHLDIVHVGNTVIVVEHEEEVIRAADWIVDVGPEAGYNGGEIVFCGIFA